VGVAQQWPFPFFIFFSIILNARLSKIKAFSKFGPKTKVAPNIFLYNFALKYNLGLQLDFEL